MKCCSLLNHSLVGSVFSAPHPHSPHHCLSADLQQLSPGIIQLTLYFHSHLIFLQSIVYMVTKVNYQRGDTDHVICLLKFLQWLRTMQRTKLALLCTTVLFCDLAGPSFSLWPLPPCTLNIATLNYCHFSTFALAPYVLFLQILLYLFTWEIPIHPSCLAQMLLLTVKAP